jgi:hypothetical protein
MEVARVAFRINEVFTNELLTVDSNAGRTLIARLTAAMATEFGTTPGEQSLVVSAFWSGSIGVTAVLSTESGPPLQIVVDQLRAAIATGTLDNIPMLVRVCLPACCSPYSN